MIRVSLPELISFHLVFLSFFVCFLDFEASFFLPLSSKVPEKLIDSVIVSLVPNLDLSGCGRKRGKDWRPDLSPDIIMVRAGSGGENCVQRNGD